MQRVIISTFKMQVVPLLDNISIGSIQHVAYFQNKLYVSLSNALVLSGPGEVPVGTKTQSQLSFAQNGNMLLGLDTQNSEIHVVHENGKTNKCCICNVLDQRVLSFAVSEQGYPILVTDKCVSLPQ